MRIYTYSILILSICSLKMNAQEVINEPYPEIGKVCPNFILKDIYFYSSKTFSLNNLHGKPLIIDFFSTGCTVCFQSFPKVNNIYQEFRSQLEYFLIGRDDKYIRSAYERFTKKYNLKIPVSYDSTLCKRFVPTGYPYIIWIDPNGIIRAITSSQELTSENVRAFISGHTFKFNDVSYKGSLRNEQNNGFNYKRPFLINGNGGDDSDFLYRSFFSEWKGRPSQFVLKNIFQYEIKKVPLQIIGMPLNYLYKFAFFGWGVWTRYDSLYGKYYNNLVLEVRDSSRFKFNFSTDENLFCYSQLINKEIINSNRMQEIMQRDLQNCFGYLAHIEIRKMPYWRLIANDEAKRRLKTKGGPQQHAEYIFSGFYAKNIPVDEFLNYLRHGHDSDAPIYNETGLEWNIDLSIDAVMTDLYDVKTALQKEGLDLVESERAMKVIVISDR